VLGEACVIEVKYPPSTQHLRIEGCASLPGYNISCLNRSPLKGAKGLPLTAAQIRFYDLDE
jgi:hypothetical protein